MFSMLKTIDSKLMYFLTYNWRYPDWSKAPVSYALKISIFNIFAAAVFVILSITSNFAFYRWIDALVAFSFAMIAFYHWRLWRKLKRDGATDSQKAT